MTEHTSSEVQVAKSAQSVRIPHFSIGDAFKTGWEIFKERPGLIIGMGAIAFVINVLTQFFGIIPIVGPLIGMLISFFFNVNILVMLLNIYDKKDVQIDDIFSAGMPYFRHSLAATMVAGAAVTGAFFFFIIPLFIVAPAVFMTKYLVIDRNMRGFEAVRTSWAATKGNRLWMWIFFIAAAVFNIFGILFFIVGIVVTIPVTIFAAVHIYRWLLARAEERNVLPVEKSAPWLKFYMIFAVVMLVILLVAGAFALSYFMQSGSALSSLMLLHQR